jgi:hypothetical protein
VLGSRYDAYHSPGERELDADELREQLLAAGFASVGIVPIDLTLLPAMYLLAKRPGWPLYACVALDRLWCATPLGRWASGFAAVSRRLTWRAHEPFARSAAAMRSATQRLPALERWIFA